MKSNKTTKELLFERMNYVNPELKLINEEIIEESKDELLSDEGQNFIKKIRKQNPEMELRFRNILLNKGLNVAIEKYNEFDPEYIKQQKEKEKQNQININNKEKQSNKYKIFINKLGNDFKTNVLKREKEMGMDGALYFTLGEYMGKYNFNYDFDELSDEEQDSAISLIIDKFPELEF